MYFNVNSFPHKSYSTSAQYLVAHLDIAVLGIKPWASYMLGKGSTIELYLLSFLIVLFQVSMLNAS